MIRSKVLFVSAAVVAGALTSAIQSAPAQCVRCPPSRLIRPFPKTAWKPISTAVYQAHIVSDSVYGFRNINKPEVHIGFWPKVSGGTTYIKVCRQSYSGNLASCQTTLVQAPSLAFIDRSLNLGASGGVWGPNTSHWDGHFVQVDGNLWNDFSPEGLGLVASCW